VDGAAMRGRAQGVLLERAVKDANNNLHCVSVSCLLGPESRTTARAHCAAEAMFLGGAEGPLNAANAVTIVDGGASFAREHIEANPRAHLWRCEVHIKEDLKRSAAGRNSIEVYERLLSVPPGSTRVAEKLFSKLAEDSPLLRIPRAHICQAYLSEGVCLHGNTTGNMVEVLHVMNDAIRDKVSPLDQMLAASATYDNRNVALQEVANLHKQCTGGTGPADHDTPFLTGTVVPFVMRQHAAACESPHLEPALCHLGED
jgi:hypothetical protein